MYNPRPFNSWGSSGESQQINVTVHTREWEGEQYSSPSHSIQATPTLLGDWVEVLQVDLGQEVRLECRAEGTPQPEVIWEFEGRRVENIEGVVVIDRGQEGRWSDGEALLIYSVRVKHLGRYTCR